MLHVNHVLVRWAFAGNKGRREAIRLGLKTDLRYLRIDNLIARQRLVGLLISQLLTLVDTAAVYAHFKVSTFRVKVRSRHSSHSLSRQFVLTVFARQSCHLQGVMTAMSIQLPCVACFKE
jgi:hypothetical protein